MEKDVKILLGKLLGEVYRLQTNSDNIACPESQGQVYALLHGFETAVDRELEMVGFVSAKQVDAVETTLDKIYTDPKKMSQFKGFYDIENELNSKGVDRGTANKILRYLYADDRFVELIDKMDTSDSPTESRRFKLSEFDS